MPRQRTGLILTLTCLLLAGCGGSTIGAIATATSTRAPLPTVTPSPSPTATVMPSSNCDDVLRGGYHVTQNGDFLSYFTLSNIAYPERQLPDGLPLTPYQFTTQPPFDPVVNPAITLTVGGLFVTICNSSDSVSHSITAFTITIQSFTPYSGQLNAWGPCTSTYSRMTGTSIGGCGGGVSDLNCYEATFSSDASTGATASASPTSCVQHALPATLRPHEDFNMNIGVAMPTAAGTYTLALNYTVDGSSVSVPLADPILLAPVAHQWDGNACTTSAMQAQIPTTNPTTPYICPIS